MKKFSPMRFTAATEEAAVQGALQLVGATLEEADYEVLDQSAKGVTVRVKPKDLSAPSPVVAETIPTEPEIEAEPDTEIEAQIEEISAPAATVADAVYDSQSDDEFADELIETDEEEIIFEDELNEAPVEPESVEDENIDDEPEAEVKAPVVNPADPEAIARAHALAESFLEKMGLSATCKPLESENEKSIALAIEGEDIGILIGKQGATLQSFQYLLNLSFNNGIPVDEGMRITVDAGNYRARRQSSLEMTARAAAQRARTSGRPVRLDPMPSSERRIIHMFLQSELGITTQSEGREPQRRLVIFPGDTVSGGGSRYENRSGNGRGMGGFGRSNGGGNNRGGRGGFRR
jgi:spoIIIJ-associated protein